MSRFSKTTEGNIRDTITRSEAIDRMRSGLPCETYMGVNDWRPTRWVNFEHNDHKFRIPPEPRREAQEFWLIGTSDLPIKVWGHEPSMIQPNEVWRKRVREVLPDEIVIERRTQREWINWLDKHAHNKLDVLRALGLIAEDKS